MEISSELVAILGVGVALAGLMLAGQQRTDKRMDRIEDRLIAVETGQARMEGKLGFIENYILGRNAAPDGRAEAPAE